MKRMICGLAGALAAGGAGAAAWAQQGGGEGTAVYWMTGETMSGMGAMAQSGDPAAMARSMMNGGGAQAARTLHLQLGSPRRAAGAPSAEHLPPAGLGAGASLPLLSPEAARGGRETPDMPAGMERPRGRMLIYWGCGERARPGQPAVIDFARLAAGQVPAGFSGAQVRGPTPPSAGNHATFGEWPNRRSTTQVPGRGSLVGEHVVRGNYTPEIRFSVAQGNDFLAPVTLSANSAAPSRAVPVSWQPVANAKGWMLSTTGATESGDVIVWTSSETQMPGMAIAGHPGEAEVARLVQQKVLLPGNASQCTVPAEVAGAAEGSMLMVNAFGPEANFSHPARPANAGRNWKPEWTAKLLTASRYMGMLGMDMEAMMRGEGADEDEADAEEAAEQRPSRRGRLLRGLGGIIRR